MALTRGEYLYGDTMEIKATVRETVEVEPGDLMVLNDGTGIICALSGASATADYYAYPFAATKGTARLNLDNRFLGIAMDDSQYGSTDTISIATAGVFRFPLKVASSVTIGALMAGVSKPGSGFSQTSSTTASYQVQQGGSGSTVGYCVKTESGASNADIILRTAFGPGGAA